MSPAAILARDKVALVAQLRSKGLGIAFTADLTDGLSRTDEAPQLRALGRSLAEPAVQQLARDYVLAVDQLLQPELLGLAAETNLVRAAAPPWLYAAVVATSNAMAADLAANSSQAQLFFSVQVETAWGWGTGGTFVGIATDLQDFPFAQALGLSSYPYFLHASPDAMPDDYFRRLADRTCSTSSRSDSPPATSPPSQRGRSGSSSRRGRCSAEAAARAATASSAPRPRWPWPASPRPRSCGASS
ncbi:MAG: hypothetical protein MUC36_27860 [Planctomycetes bacterium]|jgi:hypothetical protein|nr:hypothetical protein [Planctomycetota bacterium]